MDNSIVTQQCDKTFPVFRVEVFSETFIKAAVCEASLSMLRTWPLIQQIKVLKVLENAKPASLLPILNCQLLLKS